MKRNISMLLALAFIIGVSLPSYSQSPKKYLKNGFYEQAFVEAVYKQNKKVKLKKKYTEVIFPSYKEIYARHSADILNSERGWDQSFNRFIRMIKFRAKVKHPGVYDKLGDILYDKAALDALGNKFNAANLKDLEVAGSFESVGNYEKALEKFQVVAARNESVKSITTLLDRLIIIDCEPKIENANQKIGDQYIAEAHDLLQSASSEGAKAVIKKIEKARTYRPLDLEEEELLKLANLIIGESWIIQAEKLIDTRTKKNARLAFELINRARTIRTLTAEEERLLEKAEELGMTRVLVKLDSKDQMHDSKSISGILNKGKGSRWISYYNEETEAAIDFEMNITQNKPIVVLGDKRKKVSQESKTVEYWVEETDAAGNIVKVKKTKLAVAMVATLSQTKSAHLGWSIIVKDLMDGKAVHSDSKESLVEIKHEFVSVESGDVLALPDNVESEVELDSQPFPADKEMLRQVKDQYVGQIIKLVNSQKNHLLNVNVIIE